MRNPRLFDKIGEAGLRAAITEFYARLFDDVMIGFMFRGKDRQRLIDKEYEFTAQILGADVAYTGRPMRAVHGPLAVFGGQFERRLQVLRETLRDRDVDPEVVAAWIEHTVALRPQITSDPGSECGTAVATVTPPHPDAPVKLGRK